MNPSNKTFVNAFSRRQTTFNASRPGASIEPAASNPSSVEIHPDVAGSASLRTDPVPNEQSRVDAAQTAVQKPHLGGGNSTIAASVAVGGGIWDERLASLQQVHTTYDAATSWSEPAAATVSDRDVPPVKQPQAPAGSRAGGAAPPAASAAVPASPASPTLPTDRPSSDFPIVETRIDSPAIAYPESRSASSQDSALPITEASNQLAAAGFETTQSDDQQSHPEDAELFRAAWEVDVFDLPGVVADLFFEGQLFQQIAERMLDAVNAGLGSMLVTSCERGEGRSSVAIGMSMAAAAAGLRVALVDGDAADPTLCDDLRLELDHGWIDSLRSGIPLKEIAVLAIEDGVTLIPLVPKTPMHAQATAAEFSELLDSLYGKFDLVIVDGPAATSHELEPLAAAFDSAVIVSDRRRANAAGIHSLATRLAQTGVAGIGLIENYC